MRKLRRTKQQQGAVFTKNYSQLKIDLHPAIIKRLLKISLPDDKNLQDILIGIVENYIKADIRASNFKMMIKRGKINA